MFIFCVIFFVLFLFYFILNKQVSLRKRFIVIVIVFTVFFNFFNFGLLAADFEPNF
jgi:predicted permease